MKSDDLPTLLQRLQAGRLAVDDAAAPFRTRRSPTWATPTSICTAASAAAFPK